MSELRRNNAKKKSPKKYNRVSSHSQQKQLRSNNKFSDSIKHRVMEIIQDTAHSQSQKLFNKPNPPKQMRNSNSDSTILQAHRLRRPLPMFKLHKRASPFSASKIHSPSTFTPPCFSPSTSLLRILRPDSSRCFLNLASDGGEKNAPLSPPKDYLDETAPSSLLHVTNKLSASCHPFSFSSLSQSKLMTPLVQNSQNTESQFLAHCVPPVPPPNVQQQAPLQSRLRLFSKQLKSIEIPEPLCSNNSTQVETMKVAKKRRPSLLQRSYMHSLINQEKGLRELRKSYIERVVENEVQIQEGKKKSKKLPYLVRIEALQL